MSERFTITIEHEEPGKTEGIFIVNPKFHRECSGASLVEVLSKFLIEIMHLQRDLSEKDCKEQMEIKGVFEDDIPF